MRLFIFSMSIILPIMVLGCKKDVKDLPDSCYLEPDPGPCKASIPRYYYDQNDKQCKKFIWSGCYGVVPFVTLEKCQESCE
jgi:hypothetical protein